jgi:hypothetical protein
MLDEDFVHILTLRKNGKNNFFSILYLQQCLEPLITRHAVLGFMGSAMYCARGSDLNGIMKKFGRISVAF